MDKILMFIVIVLAAVVGVLFISNMATQKSTNIPAPTIALSPAPSESTQSASPTATLKPDQIPTAKQAVIKTSKGDIIIQLYSKEAPRTVKNFVDKAGSGFYQNLTFHRVEDWVTQGGDPKGDGTGGEKMPTELNDKPFGVGAVGVARGGDIKVSNDAQFFITKKDASWLNKQYTNFGQVTAGMDVVNKIQIGDKILEINIQ